MPRPLRPCRLEALEDRLAPATVGALDPSFGAGGRVVVPTNGSESAVAADSLGRVIVAGGVPGPGDSDVGVVRFTADGRPDPSFGADGLVAIDFGGSDFANGVAGAAADHIIIAGTAGLLPGGQSEFIVARLTPDGHLDPAFGTGGKVVFNLPDGPGGATDVAIDPTDGGIVIVGAYSPPGGHSQIAVARLTPAGEFDPAFAGGGKLAFTVTPGRDETARAVTLDGAGRIVVAGNGADESS